MMAALDPEWSVSSMAHVVARGHFPGSCKFRTVEPHGACFVLAIQQPPPSCVTWVGMRASGSVLWEDGALTGG